VTAEAMADEWALFSAEESPEEGVNAQELLKIRDAANGVLSFHSGVEESLLLQVEREAPDGDWESVLQVVDHFCYGSHWMMHCGDQKATVLEQALESQQAVVAERGLRALELGTYCGYSAVRLAGKLREGDSLISVDVKQSCVGWAGRLLHKAGLHDRVTLLLGTLAQLCESGEIHGSFDFVFLDHAKDSYLEDLRLLVESSMLTPGCRVVADNVLCFQPLTEYLDYVRDPEGPFSESELHEGRIEYSAEEEGIQDGVEVSIAR